MRRGVLEPVVGDLRFLANFGLHVGAIPHANRGATLMPPNNRIRLPIPDVVEEPLIGLHGMHFEENRDVETFSEQILGAATGVVEGVLDAFERASKVEES